MTEAEVARMVGVGVLLPREGARPFRTTDVQKVRLAEACARAGLPMDGIAAAIRAGGCRSRSCRRPRALRGPVLASGADQLAASAGRVAEWASPPGVTFVDVGELALKGIAHPVRLLEAPA